MRVRDARYSCSMHCTASSTRIPSYAPVIPFLPVLGALAGLSAPKTVSKRLVCWRRRNERTREETKGRWPLYLPLALCVGSAVMAVARFSAAVEDGGGGRERERISGRASGLVLTSEMIDRALNRLNARATCDLSRMSSRYEGGEKVRRCWLTASSFERCERRNGGRR